MTPPSPHRSDPAASASVIRRAHAKINLALSVGPAQPPKGFHPIVSWMAALDLHDTLTLERLAEGAKSTYTIAWDAEAPRQTPIDWPIDKDLAVRAHRLLEAHTKRDLPLSLSMVKRIPVGGGLGGGSADAAAMFLAVNTLFGLGLDGPALTELSRSLGSDIAYFIDPRESAWDARGDAPRPALVTGLGETIERLGELAGDVLLLFPPFPSPTAPVYGAFDKMVAAPALREAEIREFVSTAQRSGRIPDERLFNDLAEPAASVLAELGRYRLEADRDLRIRMHVTGTGSTLFILLGDRTQRDRARMMAQLGERFPDLVMFPARFV
ncbi:MAG: hypothetical protein KF745_14690 [Phycisphaeraceae bacterium]|nr:hypothetical protein [Phycisphaeraceae bacterium]